MKRAPKKKLSHFDDAGAARMVDVSSKPDTVRTAQAQAFVRMRPSVLRKLPENPKGNPLEIARIAGIAAAKRTPDLIPLCHPLLLTHADVDVRIQSKGVRIVASASTTGPTGVEMEALTAATVAALTVYDMTKALDKGIEIGEVCLLEKTGGKSGLFRRADSGRPGPARRAVRTGRSTPARRAARAGRSASSTPAARAKAKEL